MLNHPKSSNANFTDDFAVLVLEKPSAFKPVALAASDDSDVKDGEWAAKMGWDDTGGEGTMAYELTREDAQLMSNANCLKETNVDKTMLCSRGTPNVTSCTGDYSGPVVVEGPSGDVLVGLTHDGAAQELAEASPGGEQTYRALMESTDVEQATPDEGLGLHSKLESINKALVQVGNIVLCYRRVRDFR
ncbi:hypothetical protein JG688_00011593 [Phytophthora aleatoria]|uniref:Peptidase S1 domain-containing protein n=1 Tax=Phytophthora aleatoria TaxID=2496075 RepID=A0A8J5J453_9STRA|nr:hypothetical protein JG688_00011593 [Phytophthora aleatoria]